MFRPIVLLAVAVSASAACRPEPVGDAERQVQVGPDSASVVVARLAAKHGANADWEDAPYPAGEFTATYQRLLEDAEVPVVAVAELVDVIREDTSYVAVFEPTLLDFGDFFWRLRCTKEQADRLMSEGDGATLRYDVVLVARIDRVTRPLFYMRAAPFSEEEAELIIESSDVRVAHGTLIDFELALGLFSNLFDPADYE